MGKPHIEAYKKFQKKFYEITKGIGKEQYLVPYLMSSHPGSTLKEAIELAVFLKRKQYAAGAGPGFLSYTGNAFNVHVLYRT